MDSVATVILERCNFTAFETEKTMKKLSGLALLACCFIFNPAFAANEQQNKMASCNKDATGKTGDDRKAFMKDCLSSKPAAAAPMTQQEKMKSCNVDATGKKGDDRKAFMKQCLSKPKG
ncbi:psiF repeat family protein [Collimonas arenae]|uniref:PsiF repeat family protein n=2 Tax=Collimonas arenae TaxID=279058 RepID=A0A127QFN2_9BURK|nr:psiF repeat family protein [Collimonas arenae]